MKQAKIAIAHATIEQMYKTKGIPFNVCQKLFRIKKKLEPFVECQNEKELAVIEENSNGVDDKGNFIMTNEQKLTVLKLFKAIRETDVEYEEKPEIIDITDELAEKLGITGETLNNLDGFIDFRFSGVK